MGLILVLAYAWWAVSLTPFSAAATLAVVVPAAAVAVLAALWLPARRPRGPVRGAWLWAGLLGVAVVWQLVALGQHPRAEHPTLSSLTNQLLDTRPIRAAAFALWFMIALQLSRR